MIIFPPNIPQHTNSIDLSLKGMGNQCSLRIFVKDCRLPSKKLKIRHKFVIALLGCKVLLIASQSRFTRLAYWDCQLDSFMLYSLLFICILKIPLRRRKQILSLAYFFELFEFYQSFESGNPVSEYARHESHCASVCFCV